MRVLIVTAAYPSAVEPGRAPFIAALAHALAALPSVRVEVLAPRIHRADPLFERAGKVTLRRFEFGSEGRILKSYEPRPPLALLCRYAIAGTGAALAAVRRSDVVYGHWVLPVGPLGAAAALLSRRPFVLHVHGSDVYGYATRSAAFGLLARFAVRCARLTLVVNRELEHWARSAGAREVEVVPLAPDESRFKPPSAVERRAARESFGLPDDARAVCFVGDRTGAKGYPEFLAAVSRLGAPWRALVACGMPPEEIPRFLHAADVFCLPSRSEGAPVALIEALFCGLPVVASRVGGIPELVREGEDAILVPPGDVAALAGAIGRALDLPRKGGGPRLTLGGQAARIAAALERSLGTRREGMRDAVLSARAAATEARGSS